jgi:hypothetical protein
MSSLQVDFERAAPAGAALEPADEYVEFWYEGAIARGLFCCVACGRRLVSAHQLPSCPSCDGGLWEELASSPFGTADGHGPSPVLAEAWHEAEAGESTRFLRGIAFSLVVGPAIWLALAGLAFLVFELVRA